MKNKTILVLGPHTDDGEWGCGASVAKWIEEGATVHYVAFSAAEESVPNEFPKDILRKEFVESNKALGVAFENTLALEFKVRYFPRDRQEILEEMVRLNKQIKPDLVLVPCSFDVHQDHQVISREGFRAFKKASVLGYEMPWNTRNINLTFFNVVDERHMNVKVDSLGKYASQVFRVPNYAELAWSLATVRGVQIGKKYAEAFEVLQWVEN